MKVSISTLNMHPEGWTWEKEIASDMTVGRFKLLLSEEAGAPKLTASTRVLHKSATAMYSLRDEDTVKKRMVLTDPSNPAELQTSPTVPQPKATAAKESKAPAKSSDPYAQKVMNAAAESKSAPPAAKSSPAKQPLLPPAAKAEAKAGPRGASQRQSYKSLSLPVEELDSNMRGKLVEFTGSRWEVSEVSPEGGKKSSSPAMAVWSKKQVVDFLRDLNGRLRETISRKTFAPCTTTIYQTFGISSDLTENGEHGVPRFYDAVLRAANEVTQLYRPLLSKWALPETVAAIVATQQAVESHLDAEEVFDLVVKASFSMTLTMDKTVISDTINHLTWSTWLLSCTNPVVITHAYLHHLALQPLQCRRCSYARTIAYAEVLMQQTRQELLVGYSKLARKEKRPFKTPDRVVWIFEATAHCEGELARRGYFEDAGVLRGEGFDAMSIYLIGPGMKKANSDEAGPRGGKVKVSIATYDEVANCQLPDPSMIFFFNSGLGTLELKQYEEVIPHLIESLKHRCAPPPSVVLTCRSESEVRVEAALLDVLGVSGVWSTPSETTRRRHVRNLFSAMAGNPDIECDENGWMVAMIAPEERLCELLEYQKKPELLLEKVSAKMAADGDPAALERKEDGDEVAQQVSKVSKSPVTFWGILDLKYDPRLPLEQRVKVLETGDGRASKFSGYGAAIKDAVQNDMKMQDTIRRAVMVENKKLFHDIIVENGYEHVRPDQEAFPKAYDANLAALIKSRFYLAPDDICVLKLVNRARGAGVIPVAASDLDEALKILLQPPNDVQAWLAQQPSDWAQKVEWGCFEEQVRHWWSNECPCFLVEQFCKSVSTEKSGMQFDGTMRVGFALMREDRDRIPPGWVVAESGLVYVGDPEGEMDDRKLSPVLHPWGDPRPWLDLFRENRSMLLRICWLGGYWKLPVEPADSSDLRGRIVSVAKRGTAPVSQHHLNDVYSILGDMVPVTFNTRDMSHNSLLKRYTSFPELGAFITTRLACSMRMRDKQKSLDVMRLAQSHISKLDGQPKKLADSYIYRNLAVFDAGHGNWTAALQGFKRSLDLMPCNATTRFLMGLYHLEHKNHEECIRFIEESILLDPDFKAPYACLAVAHLQSGNYSKALEVSESGLKRHPGVASSSYNLGAASFAAAAELERRGPKDNVDEIKKLRAKALENLTFARDNRSKEQAWTEEDDRMVEVLSDGRKRLDVGSLPCDGWRIVNWRP